MSIASLYPPLDLPNQSITDFLFPRMAQWPQGVALVDFPTGNRLTFQEVMAQSRSLGAALQQRGVGPGTVVAIFCPNRPEYAVVLLGVALTGATLATINPIYTAKELRHLLQDSGATVLFTVPALLPVVAAAGHPLRERVVLGAAPGATSLAALLSVPATSLRPVTVNPERDVLALPFSSGTTSLPKGVRLTHRNLIANVCQVDLPEFFNYRPGESILGLLPFFHSFGLTAVLLAGLYRGATIVTLPKFDRTMFLQAMAKHKVVTLHVAPPVVQFLAKDPAVADYDLSHLRDILSGAAPLGQELAEACVRRLGCSLRQGYGMTEMSPVSHILPLGVHKYSSVGRLVPSMLMKLVDPETGRLVGPGERGELLLRGPNVMQGYHNNPEDTAQTIDPEGYLHTGDIGYMDADGDVFIVDRCKELIKVKGFQVAPAELEDLLHGHPAVEDCGVVGIAVNGDEAPKAFVVLKSGLRPSPQLKAEIIAWAAKETAWYKQIREVSFVAQIPKSATGKILRRELRALPKEAELPSRL
eukprot:EG_transcript_6570